MGTNSCFYLQRVNCRSVLLYICAQEQSCCAMVDFNLVSALRQSLTGKSVVALMHAKFKMF